MHEDDICEDNDEFENLNETVQETQKYNLDVKSGIIKNKGDDEGYQINSKAVIKDKSINPYDKLVYSILLGFIRKLGRGRCNPSILTISNECAISQRQVSDSLKNLRRARWVSWINTGKSSHYRVFSAQEHDLLLKNSGKCISRSDHGVLKILKTDDMHNVPNKGVL